MTRTAAEVERDVEASRGNLDRTVDALREKMTPGQLFDEASRAMGGAGQQVLSKFVEQAKENPMPLAVMGLGLAWLMTNSGKTHAAATPSYGAAYAFSAPGSDLSDKVHAVGDKAGELVSGAREKVSEASASIGELGRSAANRASQYTDKAQRSFTQILEREPLLMGAAGLLVGAAIGAALPPTDVEDRLVGSLRDKVVEGGKDLAQSGLQQAGEVAQTAYTAVKSELADSGEAGAAPAERVEAAVRAGAQAVREGGDGAAT